MDEAKHMKRGPICQQLAKYVALPGIIGTAVFYFIAFNIDSSMHMKDFLPEQWNNMNMTSDDMKSNARWEHMTNSDLATGVPAICTSNTTCTLDSLKNYYQQNDYFPHSGTWVYNSNNNHRKQRRVNYAPSLCNFPKMNPKDSSGYFYECLLARNITKIVIMGDSNAHYHYEGLRRVMSAVIGGTCKETRTERSVHNGADLNYYQTGSKINLKDYEFDIRIPRFQCRGCESRFSICTNEGQMNTKSIYIEYIGSENYLDNSLIIVKKKNCQAPSHPCEYTLTSQEFIFRYYLRDNYPDLLLMFANSHDHMTTPEGLENVKLDLSYLNGLIDLYIPKETLFFWFSTHREHIGKKPQYFQRFYKDHDLDPDASLQKVNRDLFDVIKDRLVATPTRMFSFFDLYAMSEDLVDWCRDGVHYSPIWYGHVQTGLLQTICASPIKSLRQFN